MEGVIVRCADTTIQGTDTEGAAPHSCQVTYQLLESTRAREAPRDACARLDSCVLFGLYLSVTVSLHRYGQVQGTDAKGDGGTAPVVRVPVLLPQCALQLLLRLVRVCCEVGTAYSQRALSAYNCHWQCQ